MSTNPHTQATIIDTLGIDRDADILLDEDGPVSLDELVRLWDELDNPREMLTEPEPLDYEVNGGAYWER